MNKEERIQRALGTLPKWKVNVKIKYGRRRRRPGRRRRYPRTQGPMYFPTSWTVYDYVESWVYVNALYEKSARVKAVKKVKEFKKNIRVRTMSAKRI